MADEGEGDIGAVVRSALDSRCWFAAMEGTDIMTSEGHCSSSVRRVKAYVESQACHFQNVEPSETKWVRLSDDMWVLRLR